MSSNPSAQLSPREEQQRPSWCSYTTSFLIRDSSTDPACSSGRVCGFHHPLRRFLSNGCLPLLMTSSAVFPWNGASHGPPICLHVIVFIYHLLVVLSPPFGRAGHG